MILNVRISGSKIRLFLKEETEVKIENKNQ
jgi:hypothetical protein